MPVTRADGPAGSLRPALVGLARGHSTNESATLTALLVDLSNRGHLRLRKAADSSHWMIERCRDTTTGRQTPRVPLALYERRILRTLFRLRRRMWLSDLSTRGWALQRAYALLDRKAGAAVRADPSLSDTVREFFHELSGLKPKRLDDDARRDYLPYVLAYCMYHDWRYWGVRPPFKLPTRGPVPLPGSRPKPSPDDDIRHPPAIVADVLHATIHPIFEDRWRRRYERELRQPYREWTDPPF